MKRRIEIRELNNQQTVLLIEGGMVTGEWDVRGDCEWNKNDDMEEAFNCADFDEIESWMPNIENPVDLPEEYGDLLDFYQE